MRRFPLPFCVLALLSLFPLGAEVTSKTDAPYVVPQTIFVGDRSRLVVPLPETLSRPFVLKTPETLPATPELAIERVELEHRGGNSRLLIDFVPYAPGTLVFPDLRFLLGEEPEDSPEESQGGEAPNVSPEIPRGRFPPGKFPQLAELEVQVASILTPSQMILSEPASPLTVPGTSLLIYGTVVLLLLVLSAGIGSSYWGRRHFGDFWESLRRRRLLRRMMKFIRRVRQECAARNDEKDGGKTGHSEGGPDHYLTLLAGEFREFLSRFTDINCRSLTAGEFLELRFTPSSLDPAGLCRIFRNWDTLRFSGKPVEAKDLTEALDETEALVIVLDRAEKSKLTRTPLRNTPEPAGAATGGAAATVAATTGAAAAPGAVTGTGTAGAETTGENS